MITAPVLIGLLIAAFFIGIAAGYFIGRAHQMFIEERKELESGKYDF